eukprot:9413004-Prorocentrum_lima.AAC.1
MGNEGRESKKVRHSKGTKATINGTKSGKGNMIVGQTAVQFRKHRLPLAPIRRVDLHRQIHKCTRGLIHNITRVKMH